MLGTIADAVARFDAGFSRLRGWRLCRPGLRSMLRVTIFGVAAGCDARLHNVSRFRRVGRDSVPGVAMVHAVWFRRLRYPWRSIRSRSVMFGAIADAVARFDVGFSRLRGCRL
jgi:CRISPR/Cas system-associated exonuclease Cas4 (RecB family)